MKISMLIPILGLATGLTMLLAGEASDDAKKIEGIWLPLKVELAGKPMSDAYVKKMVYLKMDSGKYEVQAESLDKGTYTINASAKPKTIDIVGVEGPNAGKKIPSIYELDGDTLRICYGLAGDKRPVDFKTTPGTMNLLITYQRKKTQ